MHRTTERFWKCFSNLSEPVQKIAKKNFEILRINPTHPSLYFKRVGNFHSVRIGLNYRALAVKDNEDFIWVWIGSHDDYDQLLKG